MIPSSKYFGPEAGVADTGAAGGGGSPTSASPASSPSTDDNNPWADSSSEVSSEPKVGHVPAEAKPEAKAPPIKDPKTGQFVPAAKADPVAPAAPVAAAPTAALTAEQIAQISAQAAQRVASQNAPTQQQASQDLTDEEYNKLFNVARVDEGLYEQVFGFKPENPKQVQALHTFGQSVARQAVTMAKFLIDRELKTARGQLEERLNPIVQNHTQSRDKALYDDFYTTNPELKDYEAVVQDIIELGKARQLKFKTKEELFSHVAGEARRRLTKALSAPTQNDATTANQTTTTQPQAQRRMTATSMGGQSTGTGTATSENPYTNDAKSIFG